MASRKGARKLPKSIKLKRTRRPRRFRKTKKIKGGFKWPWQWFRAAQQEAKHPQEFLHNWHSDLKPPPNQPQNPPDMPPDMQKWQNEALKQRPPISSNLQSYAPLFGMEIEKNKKLFNNYVLYKEGGKWGLDVQKKWGPLGAAESANGNVCVVTFNMQNVVVPAVIKQAKDAKSDNLMYEYRVGRFLNKYCSILPSFTYTYGIYTHLTLPTLYEEMPVYEQSQIALKDYSIQEACSKEDGVEKLCLLIQYFHAIAFYTFFKSIRLQIGRLQKKEQLPLMHDVHCVLFQIYYSLHALNGKFQHNDLHDTNVLVKELSSKIKFKFTWGDKIVEFNTRYLAKIIDYGRSNYYEDPTRNSEKDMEATCEPTSGCTVEETKSPSGNVSKLCGKQEGFYFIQLHVQETKRDRLKKYGKYIYDSELASKAFFEPKVYDQLFVTAQYDSGSEITDIFKLKDESYEPFLNELAKVLTNEESLIDQLQPSRDKYAELVVNGIDPMVFTPTKSPIDSPYIPPDGWTATVVDPRTLPPLPPRRNWLPAWFTRREPRRNRFQTRRNVAPVAVRPAPPIFRSPQKFSDLQKYPPLFGMEMESFKDWFDDFDLCYREFPVFKQWKPLSFGDNGKTYLVTFTSKSVSIPAVLKNASDMATDNLMYEFRVGQYLNEFCSKLPCFVYTYGIYTNLPLPGNKFEVVPRIKKEDVTLIDKSMNTACDPDIGVNHLSLLTQYIANTVSLADHMSDFYKLAKTPIYPKIWEVKLKDKAHDLRCMLFQIYYALHILNKTFEHNDLHAKNVLVKKLNTDLMFQFTMKNGTVVEFKSKYLVKIIDYGRSKYPRSEAVLQNVCKAKLCNREVEKPNKNVFTTCGKAIGFGDINTRVQIANREDAMKFGEYKPDSDLVLDVFKLSQHSIFTQPVLNELFDEPIIFAFADKKYEYKLLRDKTYAALLLELGKAIQLVPMQSDPCAVLEVDGVNTMKFTPGPTPIDNPYIPNKFFKPFPDID